MSQQVTEAKLALQAQVEPHFYNTLASVQATEVARAAR
jgi:sensor histidine kinase YesM